MELTESWRTAFPQTVLDRYNFVETRNASANFKGAHPDLFKDVVEVLEAFYFDVERIVRSGGSKHLIAMELDEAFRLLGWREANFEQTLQTTLILEPFADAGERGQDRRRSTPNEYKGHKIDNVKGRVGLDVEWNPKDGNLDRDFANFRALYDAGVLDLGIILTRMQADMRELWRDSIHKAKEAEKRQFMSSEWAERLKKTPNDPLGTSTTSNFEKLVNRIERGDGGGCPILAIAITTKAYKQHLGDFNKDLTVVALSHQAGTPVVRMAERMGLGQADLDEVSSDTPDEDDAE